MDAAPQIDYQAVRSDLIARRDELDARRKELDAAIAAVEKILVSGIANAMESRNRDEHSSSQPINGKVFANSTIVDAARMYLESTKKAQSVKQIVDALRRGGYVFESTNPTNTVGAVLHRAAVKKRHVVKVGVGLYDLLKIAKASST